MIILLEFKDQKIPSVNSIYLNRRGGGKYLSPEATSFRSMMVNQLNRIFNQHPEKLIELKNIPLFDLHIEYVMKQSVGRRDLDNLHKLTQDSLFQFLGINDARVVSLKLEKYNRTGGSYEFIVINISESKIDINKYL
jgi:Holliday junction resolvase RusA-like endonuclease